MSHGKPLTEHLPQPVIELPTFAGPDGERIIVGKPAYNRRGKGRTKRGFA
jgi:hypothetical protein